MKIVIATNGLPAATHAINEAIRLLPLAKSQVFLVSVLDPEDRIGGNEDAPKDLEQGLAILKKAAIDATAVERRGHFAQEIVAYARELGADLIVLGSDGIGTIARLFVGSVSADVIETWTGAVLVVRHP